VHNDSPYLSCGRLSSSFCDSVATATGNGVGITPAEAMSFQVLKVNWYRRKPGPRPRDALTNLGELCADGAHATPEGRVLIVGWVGGSRTTKL
jgi:hypothetical protein